MRGLACLVRKGGCLKGSKGEKKARGTELILVCGQRWGQRAPNRESYLKQMKWAVSSEVSKPQSSINPALDASFERFKKNERKKRGNDSKSDGHSGLNWKQHEGYEKR